jgi:hypothetical protein
MIFTLEALQAEHGDALLLHYGPAADPRLIMVDGGPGRAWTRTVRARLDALRDALAVDPDPLVIDLLMVSHIDDDHVGGLLGMTRALLRNQDDGDPLPYDVLGLWHNAFEDILADPAAPASIAEAAPAHARTSSATVAAALPLVSEDAQAVLASVDQGRRLRDDARALGIPRNRGFRGVVRRTVRPTPRAMGAGLTLEVIGPTQARLAALRKHWDDVVRKKNEVAPASWQAEVAAFVDRSVANLASIVAIVRAGGASILLTGDARGDDMLEGLRQARLMRNGVAHFDVFKLPHHGSIRNVAPILFESVTADHYVISANGRHHNPDVETLELLVAARGTDEYTIHLTNPVPHAVAFLDGARQGKRFRFEAREDPAPSVSIDLGEALPAELRG